MGSLSMGAMGSQWEEKVIEVSTWVIAGGESAEESENV